LSIRQQMRAKWASLFRSRADRELEAELRFHLETQIAENLRRGMTRAEAVRHARVQLGGAEQIKEEVRSMRWGTQLELLLQDVRFAARMLAKQPSFTMVAVMTLALGIGANTAIFSVLNAVLLRPLPFAQSEQLVRVFTVEKSEDPRGAFGVLSYPDLLDYAAQNKVFSHMAGVRSAAFTLTGGAEPQLVFAEQVSADMFPMLGVQPLLGRTFTKEEDQRGGPPVVVLSYSFWQQHLGGDAGVLGQPLAMGLQFQGSGPQIGARYTIIGVLPREFRSLSQVSGTAVPAMWLPLGPVGLIQRTRHSTEAFARLKAGVTLQQASGELQTIAAQLAQAYPDSNKNYTAAVVQIQEEMVRESRGGLWMLLGVVSLVLLIGCANVANLLLTRTSVRSREIAIRMALGAGRARVMRLLLAEGLLLALAGGMLGAALAALGVETAVKLYPGGIPRLAEANVDGRVLLYVLLVSCGTGLLFNVAPALHAASGQVFRSMKEGAGASAGAASMRYRNLLAAGEIALAVVLLVGAGLLLRSFSLLLQVPAGFDTGNRMTFRISLPRQTYGTNEQAAAFYNSLLQRLRSLPGMQRAAAVNILPLSGGFSCDTFQRDDRRVPEEQQSCAEYRAVSTGYFSTMGIALAAGREFNEGDTAAAPPVAVINEAMAQRFWPGLNPIGMRVTPDSGDRRSREIIGVVRNLRQFGLDRPVQPELYIAYGQDPWARSMVLVLHTAVPPLSIYPQARAEVLALDKNLPIFSVRSLEEVLGRSVAEPRFRSGLLGAFAALALFLAMIGTYSVISVGVTQRTREFGIRMALGAQPADILRHVFSGGMIPVAAGLAIGLAGALGGSRFLTAYLFQVTPADAVTFTAVAGLLGASAAAAIFVPARRATRVNPLAALRHE